MKDVDVIGSTRSAPMLSTITQMAARASPVIVALACLWLGYMVIWQRGPYMDDYAYKNAAIDVVTGQRRFVVYDQPDRKLSMSLMMNLGGVLPTHELPVRALLAATTGLNALLLALLVWRLTGSKVASLISGWLFLMPFAGAEAVLWMSAASEYPFELLFGLLFLHSCCSACAAGTSARAWGVFSAVLFITSLSFGEQMVLAIGLVPLIGLAVAACEGGPDRRLALKRALGLMLVPMAFTLLVAVVYRNVPNVLQRGGMDASVTGVVKAIPDLFFGLKRNTIARDWGVSLTTTAFDLGRQVLEWSKRAQIALATAVLGLLLVVLTWRRHADENSPPFATFSALFVVGVLWFFGALVFPAALVSGQIYQARLIYIPLAGAAAACGAAAGMLGWIGRRLLARSSAGGWIETACVAAAGVALVLASIVMLGYSWSFAERSRVDDKQVSAFLRSVPVASLPARAVVVPWRTDEEVLPSLGIVRRARTGVFETIWSSTSALQAAYQRKDISAVASNRWVPLRFAVRSPRDQALDQVRIHDKPVPIGRTLMFTYEGGVVYSIGSLTLKAPDGSTQTVRFPIAEALRAAGLPVLANIEVSATGD